MLLSRAARAATVEDMRGKTVALELRRQCHCCAYNALVALISCTQTELKFYVGFLFSENPVKVSECTHVPVHDQSICMPLEVLNFFVSSIVF